MFNFIHLALKIGHIIVQPLLFCCGIRPSILSIFQHPDICQQSLSCVIFVIGKVYASIFKLLADFFHRRKRFLSFFFVYAHA